MPFWVPLIMAVLGTGIQNRTMRKANQRRMNEINIGREKEKREETQQRADVMQEAEAYDPTLRQEALDTEAAKTEEQINEVLSDNELMTTGDTGVISEGLQSQRVQSARDKANRASILAALRSKVRAPRDVGAQEEMDMLDLIARSQGRTSKMGRIGRTTQTLADLVGQPNSNQMMIGGLMSGLGLSAASNQIMKGLQPPASAAVPNMTPNPNYKPLDWNDLARDWQG